MKPIKTEHDYNQALARIDELMDAEPDTPEGDELDVLSMLVDHYESRHFPLDPPDPIEALLFRMDQLGLTRKDIEPLIGGRARVSEVLNRKRRLSLTMIRNLHERMQVPADVLIRDYEVRR
ncbi:MAG: hypothetical protein COW30_01500 [Rhodospirillales bacterium CG15_BIG_FIL_POST_REV_8_21_14_020_66_15]|nr:MAG: hypothetical protein COW30_01500 [Rhodospirillales bacterium CG15_BIG_FIL_POST_REV_8_21_14_020_66_15]